MVGKMGGTGEVGCLVGVVLVGAVLVGAGDFSLYVFNLEYL